MHLGIKNKLVYFVLRSVFTTFVPMQEDFDIRQERLSKSEQDFENALRPLKFSDFSGQQKVVENLEVFVEAAKYRGEPLDHTLLHGPPGLGKTTLSNIIASELGVGFKITSGPVLDKPGGLQDRHHDRQGTVGTVDTD